MGRAHPLHVRLVEDRVRPRHARSLVVFPVEAAVDDDPLRHAARAVTLVGDELVRPVLRSGVAGHRRSRVREDGLAVVDLALDGARVRIDEQLVRIEDEAARRLVGAPRTEAVALSGTEPVDVAVPDVHRLLAQRDPRLAMLVEEAEIHARGVLGVDGEVHALSVEGRAEGRVAAGPHGSFHGSEPR